MIHPFKKKRKEANEEFTIGEVDFRIDLENSTVEMDGSKIIDLTIKTDEGVFDTLCEDDDFEFGYGLYPPEFYVREVDLGRKGQITINEKNQHDHEITLYFMEHHDVNITLRVDTHWISATGWTLIDEKKYPIQIRMKTTYNEA